MTLKSITSLFLLCLLIMVPSSVLAFNIDDTGQPIEKDFAASSNFQNLLTNIVNDYVWPVAVSIVIILFVIAGLQFVTAQGEVGKLEIARRFLIWAIIGVIVIVLAFSILQTLKYILGV